MSKKNKKHQEEGKENSERWLLTYSDMITLLLALFIILYAISNTDAEKYKSIAEQFGNAFHASNKAGSGSGAGNGDGTGYGDGSGTGYDEYGSALEAVQSEINESNGTASGSGGDIIGGKQGPLDEIYTVLTKYVSENHLEDEISLINTSTYVQIRIKGVLMFYPDSPEMLNSSKPIIKKISNALKGVYDRVDHITITGNTADVGEHNKQTDAFSWYLSISRADTVRRSLVEDGLNEDKLSLEGYGHYNPIAPNDTEANRAKNRRAEITVYKYQSVNEQTSSTSEQTNSTNLQTTSE